MNLGKKLKELCKWRKLEFHKATWEKDKVCGSIHDWLEQAMHIIEGFSLPYMKDGHNPRISSRKSLPNGSHICMLYCTLGHVLWLG